MDFSAGPTAGWLTVARATDGPAVLTLRLDDPLGGPVIGTARASCQGGPYGWTPVVTPVAPVTGRRDLYVVFDEPDVRLRDLSFGVDPEPAPATTGGAPAERRRGRRS
jgi:beta-glucosidase